MSGKFDELPLHALGQMFEKSGTLVQGEAGRLLGEYDGSGNLIEETVRLGDIRGSAYVRLCCIEDAIARTRS